MSLILVQQGKDFQDEKLRDDYVTFYPLGKRNDIDRICPGGQFDFSRDRPFRDSVGRRRHEVLSIDRQLHPKIDSSPKDKDVKEAHEGKMI